MAWEIVEAPYCEFSKAEIKSFFEVIYVNLSGHDVPLLLKPLGLYDAYLYWHENSGLLP